MNSSELRAAAKVVTEMWRVRLNTRVSQHLHRDQVSRLLLTPARYDPYTPYARLRAAGPFYTQRSGVRATGHHALCRQILRDRRFGTRPPGDPGLRQPPESGMVFDLGMLERDAPDHGRLRRLVMPAFSPKMMDSYRPTIEKAAGQLLDRVGTGGFDLIDSYANPLPVTVITTLLGVDGAESERISRHGSALVTALNGIRSLRHLRQLYLASADLDVLFEALIEQRRQHPGTDVVSTLLAAEREGSITGYELFITCNLLLVAGFETTVNLIGTAVQTLLRHPDQWALLCERPELAAAAVEEVLRFDPPVQHTSRVAHEAVEIEGELFKPGDRVILLLGSAGRDPAVYDDPDTFDITRTGAPEHLAFSAGPHYCLGAPLARLEAEIGLRQLAERLPTLHAAGRPVLRKTVTIRGLRHFPVAA